MTTSTWLLIMMKIQLQNEQLLRYSYLKILQSVCFGYFVSISTYSRQLCASLLYNINICVMKNYTFGAMGAKFPNSFKVVFQLYIHQ